MPAPTLALAATLLSVAVSGNHIDFKLDRGDAEMTWVTASTFRFRRSLAAPLAPSAWKRSDAVRIGVSETPAAVTVRSDDMQVSIQKRGLLVTVRRLDGQPLLSDAAEPRSDGAEVVIERSMPRNARFYGLGPRTDPGFDLRGKALDAESPFLLSTAGYGEYHVGGGAYRFDFTGSDKYVIHAPRIDYFFYYGPEPKTIFQERHHTRMAGDEVSAAEFVRPLMPESGAPWRALGDDIRRLTHAAMSGMLPEKFFMSRYAGAPEELLHRVSQVGSLASGAQAGVTGLSDFRKQLNSFFASYAVEKQEKGYPVWHPLPFQFPDDSECALHADQFILGDELLVAPVYQPGGGRTVYLPRGIWTNLESNEVFDGRKTITVHTDGLPVFARNGTILPLDSGPGMILHYFPKLGAEFFVLETASGDWTKIHAAPAADIMRLEIDSKATRGYQWVVHHVDRPAAVGFEDSKYAAVGSLDALDGKTWFYDAERRNLYVRVSARQGENSVVHVEFE